jgi:molybdopterin synthase sulfur carrier subunit|nr:hypothetical protein [Neorhizobium tomejilense]
MKDPNPINLQTTEEVRKAGWQAETRDADGHLIRVHAPFESDDAIVGMVHEALEHGESVTIWPTDRRVSRSPRANAALIRNNRKMLDRWREIVEDGPDGNEPLGAVVRALEKTTDALASSGPQIGGSLDTGSAVREALEMLLVQALQSELNSPGHKWGMEAIAKARAVLGGKWAVQATEDVTNAK